ncbi:MAG TPA: type II secretion system F family protein [Stellaceae bacterium]|jgi:tight adherence protein B|nr:type II secretion system F family protein [Stellaceae bacterium]
MLDPVTMVALGFGVMIALAVVLIGGLATSASGRRYRRRLAMVSVPKRATAMTAGTSSETRSLSRRESATPTMDRYIKQFLPHRDLLDARLARTGRQITVGHYAIATGILTVVSIALLMLFVRLAILPNVLIGLAIGVGLPHLVIGHMGKARIKAFLNLFPDAIDLIVRALRSGLPVSEAIISAGAEIGDPVGVEFGSVEGGMRMGRELDSLLWDIAKRIDSSEYRFFIIALGVQRETGGNLAETLANLSDLLRRRRSMRQKTRAMSSEARASTMILGSLPIVVTGILFLTSPNYIMILFNDVRGLMLIALALGMLVTGIGIMIKMAKFEI